MVYSMNKKIKDIKIIITGPPGSGKSTLISKLVEYLKTKNYVIGGITTPEIRKGFRRVGFKIVNLSTGTEEIMASIFYNTPYRVGRYSVNLDVVNNVGVNALLDALNNADVIIIDEIGKMELLSEKFIDALRRIFSSNKTVIATIGEKVIPFFYDKVVENRDTITLIRITPRAWGPQYEKIVSLLGI